MMSSDANESVELASSSDNFLKPVITGPLPSLSPAHRTATNISEDATQKGFDASQEVPLGDEWSNPSAVFEALTSELVAHTFTIAVGSSSLRGDRQAVQHCVAVIKGQLDSSLRLSDFGMVVVFCNQHYNIKRVMNTVAATFPNAIVHGCTSAKGVLCQGSAALQSLTLWCCYDKRGLYHSVGAAVPEAAQQDDKKTALDEPNEEEKVVDELILSVCDKLRDHGIYDSESMALNTVVWMSATPGLEEGILKKLAASLPEAVAVIGGTAADDTIGGAWSVFGKSSLGVQFMSSRGVVLTAITPSVAIKHYFMQPYVPMSECSGIVTETRGRTIVKIKDDNKTEPEDAQVVYRRWVEKFLSSGYLPAPDSSLGDILAKSTICPLGRVIDPTKTGSGTSAFNYMLVHPSGLPSSGEIDTFAAVPVNSKINLMQVRKQNLLSSVSVLQEQLASDLARAASVPLDEAARKMAGGLMVYCAGCMFETQRTSDAPSSMKTLYTNLSRAFINKPFVTMFPFGEQGCAPRQTHSMHGNLMFACVAFSLLPAPWTVDVDISQEDKEEEDGNHDFVSDEADRKRIALFGQRQRAVFIKRLRDFDGNHEKAGPVELLHCKVANGIRVPTANLHDVVKRSQLSVDYVELMVLACRTPVLQAMYLAQSFERLADVYPWEFEFYKRSCTRFRRLTVQMLDLCRSESDRTAVLYRGYEGAMTALVTDNKNFVAHEQTQRQLNELWHGEKGATVCGTSPRLRWNIRAAAYGLMLAFMAYVLLAHVDAQSTPNLWEWGLLWWLWDFRLSSMLYDRQFLKKVLRYQHGGGMDDVLADRAALAERHFNVASYNWNLLKMWVFDRTSWGTLDFLHLFVMVVLTLTTVDRLLEDGNGEWTRAAYAAICVTTFLRSLPFWVMSRRMGPLQLGIRLIMNAVAKVLIVLLLVLLAFSLAITIVLEAEVDSPAAGPNPKLLSVHYGTADRSLVSLFYLLFGDSPQLPRDEVESDATYAIAHTVLGLYLLFSAVLLLNLLIAIMTRVWDGIADASITEWRVLRAKNILASQYLHPVPPPFTLIAELLSLGGWCVRQVHRDDYDYDDDEEDDAMCSSCCWGRRERLRVKSAFDGPGSLMSFPTEDITELPQGEQSRTGPRTRDFRVTNNAQTTAQRMMSDRTHRLVARYRMHVDNAKGQLMATQAGLKKVLRASAELTDKIGLLESFMADSLKEVQAQLVSEQQRQLDLARRT